MEKRAKRKKILAMSGKPLKAFMFLDKGVLAVPVGTTELFVYRGREVFKLQLPERKK